MRFFPLIINMLAGIILSLPASFSAAPPAPLAASAEMVDLTQVGSGDQYLLTYTTAEPADALTFRFDFGDERIQRVGTIIDAFDSNTWSCITLNAEATCSPTPHMTSATADGSARFLLHIDRWPLHITVTRYHNGARIEQTFTIGEAS